MTRRWLPPLLLATMTACRGGGDDGVLDPTLTYDVPGLLRDRAPAGDRSDPNDLAPSDAPEVSPSPDAPDDLDAGLTAVAFDGAVLGTVASDGAVLAPDGALVGGVLPDGAVVTPDGALLGTVLRDGGVDVPVGDATVGDGATSTGDGGFPVSGDSAVRVDARLPDGALACAEGWRPCEDFCIAPGTCCPSDACPGGRACPAPGGRCTCFEMSRLCGAVCLPQDACCGDADCPSPYRCRGNVCVDADNCNVGLRGCNGMCIPIGNCCSTADCRGGTCPRPGSLCEGGDTCAIGARLCEASRTCIPERTCCSNADCAGGLVCPRPGGQCGCAPGRRFCGAQCIPTDSCCTDDDCPLSSCPGIGMMCPPIPPRIPVKRWGIDRVLGMDGMPMEPPVFRRYELTTTMEEETALRMAFPDRGGDVPRLALANERYFTVYGPGVCPRNTSTLWGLVQPPGAFPRADYILTVSATERDILTRDGWRAVQVGCAVSPMPGCPAGTVQIARYNRLMPDGMVERHRFTANAADGMVAFAGGYIFEGLGFCAF